MIYLLLDNESLLICIFILIIVTIVNIKYICMQITHDFSVFFPDGFCIHSFICQINNEKKTCTVCSFYLLVISLSFLHAAHNTKRISKEKKVGSPSGTYRRGAHGARASPQPEKIQ